MEKFNGECPLRPESVAQLEKYFEYRWKYNRNNAISTQEDRDLLMQLPRRVQIQISSEFLFKEFAEAYVFYFHNSLTQQKKKSRKSELNLN